MRKHESFLMINKTPSKSLSSLSDYRDDDTESEFDESNWLKEIFKDYTENDLDFSMSSIRNLNKRHQETIRRRLNVVSIKKRRLKKNSQRADVRELFQTSEQSENNDDKASSVYLSAENLDDDKNVAESQKRNLSLPTIDLDKKEKVIEKSTKFKSTSANQLDEVSKRHFSLNNSKLFKKRSKEDASVKKQDHKMHLDWPGKMKLWHNLRDQLPAKNHQNYHLIGRRVKNGEVVCDTDLIEPKASRRNSWWPRDSRRKESAIEIISLKQHSIKDSQVQFFVNFDDSSPSGDEARKSSLKSESQKSSKTDLNQNVIESDDKSTDDLDGFIDIESDLDAFYQVEDEQDENGLKVVSLINGFKNLDYLDHLSLNDQTKLRQTLMLELTFLLDLNGIKCEKLINKNKGRFFNHHKIKERKQTAAHKNLLFGVSLDELLQKDQNRLDWKYKTPIMVKILIDYIRLHGLDSEGIFRIPASNSRVQSLNEELKKLYFSFFSYPLGSEVLRSFTFELLNQFTIYDVIAIFKQLIRELPEPLLDLNLQEIFLVAPQIQNYSQKLQILNLLILLMNPVNRSTLKEILSLLKDVSENSGQNKMSLSNIALIVAPTLFINPISNEKQCKQIARTKNSCEITKLIINYHQILFKLPDFIINQLDHTTNF